MAEGKIKATGVYDEVAAQKSDACQLVDLQGKTLMPAFIDAHGHATMTPMFASQCDLSGCNCLADIVTALKAYQAEHQIPAGKTIIGVNYDNNFLAEARHPHRDLLDQVSTEHPVVVVHVSVHMAVGNSLALKNLGFADDMADIPGGEIGRYEDGRLDGYLAEAAMYPLLGLAFGELQSQVVQLWAGGAADVSIPWRYHCAGRRFQCRLSENADRLRPGWYGKAGCGSVSNLPGRSAQGCRRKS